MAHELVELYKLTQKNIYFSWSAECQKAFERSKQLLLSNNLLIHYDPTKPIVIHCDASPYGVGAIFGKKFVIYSDHQPLQEIFNEKKSMPIAAGRLQRWAIFLSMYQYHIEYKKGSKLGNANAFFRLPLAIENDIEPQNVHAFAEKIPLNTIQVSENTQKCKVLSEVFKRLLFGWQSPVNV